MKNAPISIRSRITQAKTYLIADGIGPFLVRSVAGSGAVRVGGMVASFGLGVLLARGLGLEQYGYYSLALAVITVAGIPGEFGLPYLVTREVAAAHAKQDNGIVLGIVQWANKASIWFAGLAAVAVLAAAAIVYNAGSPTVAAAMALGAPVIPLAALARVRGGALQGLNHVVRSQIPSVMLRPVIFGVLVGITLLVGVRLGAPNAMALYSVTALAVLVITSHWLHQRLPRQMPAQRVRSGKAWLIASLPMGLMEGMRALESELAILLVGVVTDSSTVGLLRIANVTATIGAFAIAMVIMAAMPVMARLHAQRDHVRLQKTVTSAAYAQFAGVLAFSLPLLLAPEFLLSLAFGPSFAPAGDALRVLSAVHIANAAFGPNVWLLSMTGHEMRVARAMGLGLAISLITVIPLAREFGATGAAISLAASILCWNLLTWRDARKLLGIETSIFNWPWRRSAGA